MSYTRSTFIDYLIPSDHDSQEARISSQALSLSLQADKPLSIRIVDNRAPEQEMVVSLPSPAARLLLDILVLLADGKAVSVLPSNAEITTQQAAELLNVSRPFLIQLLDRGEIPHHKVGTHRRVILNDLLAYKKRNDTAREKSLNELAALSQELDLGY